MAGGIDESATARCPTCGAELPPGERPVPVSYARVEPRLFGVFPRLLVPVVGLTLLLAAIVSLALREWVYGVMLVVLALPLLALHVANAREDPTDPLTRVSAAAFDRARGWAIYAGTAVRAWTGAGGRIAELRLELTRLRRERQRAMNALGAAAYRRDKRDEAALRERLSSLDNAIGEREQAAREEFERARAKVARSRVPVHATRELSR
ncbi:MAG TPA: hypothetical protein VFR32_12135 [Gaiellaceae bacterium]|nr:hypothetical protein [Gaiellaceae bacterium]